MTLREELARRLAESAGVIGHDLMTLNWSPVEDHDLWKTLADEVIRQMEWARRLPPYLSTGHRIAILGDLTLAPPER
jgi:hypothetical protein